MPLATYVFKAHDIAWVWHAQWAQMLTMLTSTPNQTTPIASVLLLTISGRVDMYTPAV